MKINDIQLYGYSDICNQVIIGGSSIIVRFTIMSSFVPKNICIDVSFYSKKKRYEIFPFSCQNGIYKYQEIISVDFLGGKGICCGKNDIRSRIKVLAFDQEFFSNPIGNYLYKEDFNSVNSDIFETEDHHLGVYNKYRNFSIAEVLKISELDKYPNDIIFIDRKKSELIRFVDLNLDINEIFKRYLFNVGVGNDTIFYINVFSQQNHNHKIEFIIQKLISICRPCSYYFYHVDESILEKFKFNSAYCLYDYHFIPVIKK